MNQIFVHGTLRRGQPRHHLIADKITATAEASIPGALYYLPEGYRVMAGDSGRVEGELLTFADIDGAVALLDEIHGCNAGDAAGIQRLQTLATTQDGETHPCYVYGYPAEQRERLEERGYAVPGDWEVWQEGEGVCVYLAYGSCMSRVDFARTVPNAKVMGKAVLPDYEVAFTFYASSRKGGVADVVQTPGTEVEGVLYMFPSRYLKQLDEREGVPWGMYERIQVDVLHNGQMLPVWTYVVVDKAPQEIAPSQLYRDVILDGTELLSAEYVQRLTGKMDRLMQQAGGEV